MTVVTRLNSITGDNSGRVISTNWPRRPTPDRLAASYRSFGMDFRPARKISMVPPTLHRLTSTMDTGAQFGLPSQLTPGMPNSDRP